MSRAKDFDMLNVMWNFQLMFLLLGNSNILIKISLIQRNYAEKCGASIISDMICKYFRVT